MVDSLTDGRTRIYSVPTIANRNAPTVAELNAGTDLSDLVTADGLEGFQADTATVDTTAINSTYNTTLPGRITLEGNQLTLKKQTGTDAVYNTFVHGYATHIVIRRDITSGTAWAASQKVEVYPGQAGQKKDMPPAPNELHKWVLPFFVSPAPSQEATVA
jgi:hypothetical protein